MFGSGWPTGRSSAANSAPQTCTPEGQGDPAPLHPTSVGELTIARGGQQMLPEPEGLVPNPAASSSAGTERHDRGRKAVRLSLARG